MIVGHIALSMLGHRYLRTEPLPTLAGGLFPDILDKTLCQVLHVTPSGRMWGHALISVLLSTALIRALAGHKAASSWALGYVGHLLADARGTLPLWHPFTRYEFAPSPSFGEIFHRFLSDRNSVLLEIALLVLAVTTVNLKPGKSEKAC